MYFVVKWNFSDLPRNKITKILGVVFALTLLGACSEGGNNNNEPQDTIVLSFARLPVAGQTIAPGGQVLYEITGLTPGVPYKISISGNHQTRLSVFAVAGLTTNLCGSLTSTGRPSCSAAPFSTSLYVQVTDTWGLGVTFTLNLVEAKVSVLKLARLPSSGQPLSPGGDSLFEITGLSPGTIYRVSVTEINGAYLRVFNDPALVNNLCLSITNNGNPTCSAAPRGTSLYLQVADRSDTAATFTLRMMVAAVTELKLSTMPATGLTISPAGDSIFEITGVSPGTLYETSITGARDAQFLVYDDSGLVNFLCHSISRCSAAPSGTSVFMQVRNHSERAVTFTANMVVANVNVLAVSTLPANGQTVPPLGDSLYRITGLSPGREYNISIRVDNFAVLDVFDDSGFARQLCDSFTDTGFESCNATPSGRSLFVRVTDHSGLGAKFTLDVN